MHKEDILSVGIILALVLAGCGMTYALLQFFYSIHNHGTITAIGVNVFDASGMPLTSIEWGLVDPGSSNNFIIKIQNNGTVPATISFQTQDWIPIEASNYLTLSWNYTGAILNPQETIPITLTLNVAESIAGIPEFSFDIIITATET